MMALATVTDPCIVCSLTKSPEHLCIIVLEARCQSGELQSPLMKNPIPEEVCTELDALYSGVMVVPWLTNLFHKRECPHPFQYTAAMNGQFAALVMGADQARVFVDNDVDGHTMSHMTPDDYKDMGFTTGSAYSFVRAKDDFLEPTLIIMKDQEFGDPVKVQASILVEKVYAVNEVDFSFAAQFSLYLSWTDATLWANCVRQWEDGDEPEGECKYVWYPQVRFLNAIDVTITSHYLSTDVPNKVAFYVILARGTFLSPMGFRKFPADSQDLVIEFGFNNKEDPTRGMMMFGPVNADFPLNFLSDDSGKDRVSGWTTVSVTGREKAILPVVVSNLIGTEGWLYDYLEQMRQKYPDYGQTEYSVVDVTVVVQRTKSYYMLNYVMLVIVLTAMSWVVFLIDATMLSDRCQIALALVLALNVFQLILNERMPVTSYLTPMHEYIIGSTFFVIITCLESVAVAVCSKRAAAREAMIQILGRPRANSGAGSATPRPSIKVEPAEIWGNAANTAKEGDVGRGRMSVGLTREKLDMLVAKHLDHAALVAFPVGYAVFSAVTLR